MPKYRHAERIALSDRQWPDRFIEKAPTWCSVDLRDGNQALVQPMSVEKKLAMFDLLLRLGFKEIEIGFPAASQIEFDFTRRLIEEDRIPEGVDIQVLCQTRAHLIDRSLEALRGARSAIFHLYTSTSPIHRDVTFRMGRDEVKQMALDGLRHLKERRHVIADTKLRLEFSPESFSNTETDYALEVCRAVMAEWDGDAPVILNLPATVESHTPNVYADQIEYFIRSLGQADGAIVSLHTHNDRGTGLAACELGLMAGASRVEGTLFGNGERTGNLDIVTMALNLKSQGVDSGLDFSHLPELVRAYEEYTGMEVPPRQPYAGELVFTAFSGSHQDAIKKGLDRRNRLIEEGADSSQLPWEVAYLPMDPEDIGRSYDAIIRVNSQSGKGGVAYLLKRDYGLDLPQGMRPDLGQAVNLLADSRGGELSSQDIHQVFMENYLDPTGPVELRYLRETGATGEWDCGVFHQGREDRFRERAKGPIEALAKALRQMHLGDFRLCAFYEHSLGSGEDSQAVAYVELEAADLARFWGCGVSDSVALAGARALIVANNKRLVKAGVA